MNLKKISICSSFITCAILLVLVFSGFLDKINYEVADRILIILSLLICIEAAVTVYLYLKK